MSKKKSDLKILLLQVRDDQRVRREELKSFAEYSGLAKNQIEILNVFDKPSFSPDVLSGFDSLFVGGASEASVLEPEKYPFIKSGEDILLYCIEKEIPVFASCFGFQLVVTALGGEVIRDGKDFEMGSVPIYLTNQAKDDPLFCDTPNGFAAISVHREKTVNTPPGCQLLAYTDSCHHSFRIKDKPFWAFQFHPEVDRAILIERLTIYKEKYTDNDEHLEKVLSSSSETPESNILLKKFVDRILLNNE